MHTMRTRSWLLAVALTLAATVAAAQDLATQPLDQPLPPSEPAFTAPGPRQASVFRLLGDYTVMESDRVHDVVVVAGSAAIKGRVDGDVVVVLGMADLSATADVRGSLVVVGGSAAVAAGARIDRDLVVVGGALNGPPGFAAGGGQTVIGPIMLGDGARAAVPWFTRGALWGRPIVPTLPWVWAIVGVFFLLYVALNIVFARPVGACAELLKNKPLSTFLAGLLVLLLVGPVSFVLAVSVIGLAVVPFLLSAVFVAAILGKAGVARWIGGSIVPERDPDNWLQSSRSMVVGLAAITLIYMVPMLGLVTWTTLGAFGLGAAATTFVAALRRENPPSEPAPAVPPVSTPDAAEYTPSASGSAIEPGTADLTAFPRAAFLHRLAAFALDTVLILLAGALLDLDNAGQFLFLLLAYNIVFWGWKGTTVGGIICQLRVVRANGQPLRFADALVRGLASIFSVAVLGLGCFWILWDADRQSWHDKIAGTCVVKAPKNWPLP